jgi:NADH:ubiquinone oxidoreductase subunit F (NADH-binding)
MSLAVGGPRREGTLAMAEILEWPAKGEGITGGVNIFEDLWRLMMDSSLCGLGQAAPVAIIDTLNYFRNYYENRIKPFVFLRTLR